MSKKRTQRGRAPRSQARRGAVRTSRKSAGADVYVSPLVARNASRDMVALFSPLHRVRTWRRIWLVLAEAQHEMGLPITAAQLRALRAGLDDIDLAAAARHEKRLRHDVMAHLHAFGDAAPSARGILHLGATSMDIVDNADLIIMRQALAIVRGWLLAAIDALAALARRHRSLPCLGYTHFQPAQLTTVGKRACLWCWDLVRDLGEIERLRHGMPFRGMRGATGTQAGFLRLFGGSETKVRRLEQIVAHKLLFDACEPVTGQTYSRKLDAQIVSALASVAAGVHKFANDVRLLAGLKEIEEPYEAAQVGSSAMPYKRNPMLCERATGLARFVIGLAQSGYLNAAEQWLERTLDDSSNKRLLIPEAFLATDGMLQIVVHVAGGLVVNRTVIAGRVAAELPFIATEEIMLAAAAKGGDRQALHERLRRHANAAGVEIKQRGRPNDLLKRIAADPAFAGVRLDAILDPRRHVGLAPQQVDEFLRGVIAPLRRKFAAVARRRPGINV
jgi:adenylosuccinate lyase